MQFELLNDKQKAIQEAARRSEMIDFPSMPGETICYHQPIYHQPFPNLETAIRDGNVLERLRNRFYKIQSNNGYIHEVYPAVEYYKIAFRMIRDNAHTIMIAKEEMHGSIREIQKLFIDKKEHLSTGQSKIVFDKEIHKLRSNIFTFTFSIRAVLDNIANLFQTIYGPQAGQYVSFNSLLRRIAKGKHGLGDDELAAYMKSNLEWFNLLRDARDYLAHFGALHFSLKEQPAAPVTIEIFRNIEVSFFVAEIDRGFRDLVWFLDNHCTEIVRRA